ncbi:hypothetical protein ACFL2A_03890 [Thermodesulfobacteriota bacterium]
MKTNKIITGMVTFLLLFVLASPSFPYGYGTAGDDPLITMFKKVIKEAKKKDKDWDKLKEIIKDSKVPIVNLDKYFSVNLYAKFDKSLEDKSLKDLINSTVNLVFLSMMEKFDLIQKKEFKDYDFSKGRLALNDKYYREIFKGNVAKYDKKNGTNINETIMKSFQSIQDTIGKPAKFGVGGEAPNPDKYAAEYGTIKKSLKTVFPSFEG